MLILSVTSELLDAINIKKKCTCSCCKIELNYNEATVIFSLKNQQFRYLT